MVLVLVLAFVVELSILALYCDKVSVVYSSFVVSLFSLRNVSSGFMFLYIYLEWLCSFFGGCLSAVLDFQFFAQFVLPFFPLTFVEVDA